MAIAIYAIVNNINGKMYIGSSSDTDVRFYKHRWKLMSNTHENLHLQNAWTKYGMKSFSFILVEECLNDKLLEREQFHLNVAYLTQSNYYNKNFVATKPPSQKGLTRSESTRKKLSKIRSKINSGKHHSKNTKNRMSVSHAKKYVFISPLNIITNVTNLKKFCNENGLNEGGMHSVLKGRYKQHKGWGLP